MLGILWTSLWCILRQTRPERRGANDITGQLSYTGGLDRLNLISAMPVINTVTGETVNIDTLGAIYSESWPPDMPTAILCCVKISFSGAHQSVKRL